MNPARSGNEVPHPAKVAIFARGRTQRQFARFHGTTWSWVAAVLNRRAPAPARFRQDLARFLNADERELFPEHDQQATSADDKGSS